MTDRLSPPVSLLAVRSPPAASHYEADPMRQERALEELRSELAGVHGDTAAWHAHVQALPSHSKARGGAHKVRGGKAVLTRVKMEGKMEREGEIHGAVLLRRERPCSGEQ